MDEVKYHIRKCDSADLEILVKMRLEFLKEAGHVKDDEDISKLHNEIQEYILKRIDNDLHFWVAEIEDEGVAVGAVNIWDKLPLNSGKGSNFRIGYFSNMYTRPDHRKKGMATSLMKHMLEFLKEQGIQKAMLHAMEDGKGVYRKCGFSLNENLMEMKL